MKMTRDFFMGVEKVKVKSKKSFGACIFLCSMVFLPLFCGCSNDEIQLPDKVLQGSIDGKDWTYKSANAFLRSTDFTYTVKFLSDAESVTDPCTLPSPGLAHAKAIFRPAIGSFTISPLAVDNNQVQVAFQLTPAKALIASSGFMEVYDINGQVVFGYLQAVLDDENIIEGSFQIRLCN